MGKRRFRVLFEMETDESNVKWYNPEEHAGELEWLVRRMIPSVWKVSEFQGAEVKTVAEVLDKYEVEG